MVLSGVVAVLAIVVAINFLMSLAIIRRLRLQGPVRPAIGLPRVGMQVPRFSAVSERGEVVDETWFSGPTKLVGFFAPHCPACARLRRELERKPPTEPFLAFVRNPNERSGPDEELVATLRKVAIVVPFEEGSELMQLFDVHGFPTLAFVRDGIILSSAHAVRELSKTSDESDLPILASVGAAS